MVGEYKPFMSTSIVSDVAHREWNARITCSGNQGSSEMIVSG